MFPLVFDARLGMEYPDGVGYLLPKLTLVLGSGGVV